MSKTMPSYLTIILLAIFSLLPGCGTSNDPSSNPDGIMTRRRKTSEPDPNVATIFQATGFSYKEAIWLKPVKSGECNQKAYLSIRFNSDGTGSYLGSVSTYSLKPHRWHQSFEVNAGSKGSFTLGPFDGPEMSEANLWYSLSGTFTYDSQTYFFDLATADRSDCSCDEVKPPATTKAVK